MRDSFLVTTTGAVEGYRVSTHLGPVIVPMIGAGNFIRDWFARFTDFFGGRSKSYQNAYERLLNDGLAQMIQQARAHGANAVVNLRVETSNISGGRSLMAIILYGTAVVLQQENQ